MGYAPKEQPKLPKDTRLGPVYLRVRQLSRVLPFYLDLLDLVPVSPLPGSQPGEAVVTPLTPIRWTLTEGRRQAPAREPG